MKRIIALLISALMLISCFSACGEKGFDPEEPITLTVCVESFFVETTMNDKLEDIVEHYYPDISLKFEVINSTDLQKRESQLQRLRTEIVAGEGPDIFLLSTYQYGYSDNVEPLFVNVEKTMRNNIFLPLDEYIAESEHYFPEEHLEIVMDAGKLDGEQLVLPLLYSVSHHLYDEEKAEGLEFPTWDNVQNCGDPTLIDTLGAGLAFSRMFSTIADYDALELSFTEDELLYYLKLDNALTDVEPNEELGFDTETNGFYMDSGYLEEIRLLPGEPYAHPVQNIDGGVTALIEAYAAINGNTAHPEAAFKVIELFFDKEVQSGKGIMPCPAEYHYNAIAGVATSKYAYKDPVLHTEGFLESINEKITTVRFSSDFDKVLYDLRLESFYGNDNIEKLVAETYSDMKMMISE